MAQPTQSQSLTLDTIFFGRDYKKSSCELSEDPTHALQCNIKHVMSTTLTLYRVPEYIQTPVLQWWYYDYVRIRMTTYRDENDVLCLCYDEYDYEYDSHSTLGLLTSKDAL